jgi:hypothetical protein
VFGTRYSLALDASVRPWDASERECSTGSGSSGSGSGSGSGSSSSDAHALAAGGGKGGGAAHHGGRGGAAACSGSCEAAGCGPLVDVQYKTRLKGFMRPRRCGALRSLSLCPSPCAGEMRSLHAPCLPTLLALPDVPAGLQSPAVLHIAE